MNRLILIILCAALLAACGTPAAPTVTPNIPPTATLLEFTPRPPGTLPSGVNPAVTPGIVAQPTDQMQLMVGTLFPGGEQVTLIAPGTLQYAQVTEDPNPGAPTLPPPVFQSLSLTRMGGTTGVELNIELLADGTLTRDGVMGAISPEEVALVVDALDKLRIYDLIPSFTGPVQESGNYTYALSVIADRDQVSLRAMQAYTPLEVLTLLQGLAQLGVQPFTGG
ncbi:MAG: hypothetical protein SF123_06150 [Chloroflexota bacterium]|nr:hypothetical protein [Chloroflexota bacterium]